LKLRELHEKESQLLRDQRLSKGAIEDLLGEKRGKEWDLQNNKEAGNKHDDREHETKLERQLKDKEEELNRLLDMIREK